MRSLQEIVTDNKKAALDGYATKGDVGTADVVPIRYHVENKQGVIVTDEPGTLAELGKYRFGLNNGTYKLVQTGGAPPRSAGHRTLNAGVVSQQSEAQVAKQSQGE